MRICLVVYIFTSMIEKRMQMCKVDVDMFSSAQTPAACISNCKGNE